MDLKELIEQENLHIKSITELVNQSINDEKALSTKLMEIEVDNTSTLGDKISDLVADFGGSWKFISGFFIFLFAWIIVNSFQIFNTTFDTYPYILLNLILSCIAAIQAPIIMMSQNRKEEKDRRRSRNDFMINLKAELEVRALHNKVDLLITEQMKTLFEFQKSQMEQLEKIVTIIEKKS